MECINCQNIHSVEEEYYICPRCKGTLEIKYDLETLSGSSFRNEILMRPRGMWKYFEVLPVLDKKNIRTLGEGGTPLFKSQRLAKDLDLANLFLKNDGLNPTGSFKDRQVSVGVSKAIEFDRKVVGVTSTGNVGYASAAYSALADLKCHIVIWSKMNGLGDPSVKMAPALLFGANVKQTPSIDSSFFARDSYLLMRDLCIKKGWVPLISARCINPFAEEGAKTIAYEICEDRNWNVPDWVCVPIGGGGLISELWKGFLEMKTLDFIDDLPKLAGFQSGSFQHVALAFQRQMKTVEPLYDILGKDAPAYSLDGEQALMSIRESKGFAEALSTSEVEETQKLLARKEGILAEPMGAWGVAGLISAMDKGKIQADETVIVCITGKNIDYTSILLENRKIGSIRLEDLKNLDEGGKI